MAVYIKIILHQDQCTNYPWAETTTPLQRLEVSGKWSSSLSSPPDFYVVVVVLNSKDPWARQVILIFPARLQSLLPCRAAELSGLLQSSNPHNQKLQLRKTCPPGTTLWLPLTSPSRRAAMQSPAPSWRLERCLLYTSPSPRDS